MDRAYRVHNNRRAVSSQPSASVSSRAEQRAPIDWPLMLIAVN
jgi:hypothetical protein